MDAALSSSDHPRAREALETHSEGPTALPPATGHWPPPHCQALGTRPSSPSSRVAATAPPGGSSRHQPWTEAPCDLLTVGKRGPVVERRHFGLVRVPRSVVSVGGHELQRENGVSAARPRPSAGAGDPTALATPAPPVPERAVCNGRRDRPSSSAGGPGAGGPGPAHVPRGCRAAPSAQATPSLPHARPALPSSDPHPAGSPRVLGTVATRDGDCPGEARSVFPRG